MSGTKGQVETPQAPQPIAAVRPQYTPQVSATNPVDPTVADSTSFQNMFSANPGQGGKGGEVTQFIPQGMALSANPSAPITTAPNPLASIMSKPGTKNPMSLATGILVDRMYGGLQ